MYRYGECLPDLLLGIAVLLSEGFLIAVLRDEVPDVEDVAALSAEEVLVAVLSEEGLVWPWLDIQICRRWSFKLTDCKSWCCCRSSCFVRRPLSFSFTTAA